MEIGNILRAHKRINLATGDGERPTRRYVLDTHLRNTKTVRTPEVVYTQSMEYYNPKDPYRVRIFKCHDGFLILLVVEETGRVDKIYLQHGSASPNPIDYLDPDERIRRLKICVREGSQEVYNVWPTQEFTHAS